MEDAGKTKTFLTRLHRAEVTKIVKWSEKDNLIYFVATLPDQPGTRHFYRLDPTSTTKKEPECLSCDLKMASLSDRLPCAYFDASLSPDGRHYALSCKGPDVPYVCLHETDGNANDHVDVYEDNSELLARMEGRDLPTVRMMEVPLAGTELRARVKLYLPPDFDEEEDYPLVVYVYGGPGNQQVRGIKRI